MSQYTFITSPINLPEVDLTNEKIITPVQAKEKNIKPPSWTTWDELDPNCEISYFENEDDINNLCIRRDFDFLEDLKQYTNNEFIYIITCSCDEKRANQLLNYISNIHIKNNISIYSIWVGDNADISPIKVSIDNLSTNILLNILDNYNCGLIIHSGIN